MAIIGARFRHALTPSPLLRAGGLWVVRAGHEDKRGSDAGFVDARTEQPALIRISSGCGRFAVDGGPTVAMPAGSVAVLMPGHMYSYGPDPRCREQWVMFEGPLVQAFVMAGVLVPERPVRQPRDGRLGAAWRRMVEAFAVGGPRAGSLATAALIEVLHRLADAPEGSDADDLAERVVTLIQRDPAAAWSMHGLAATLGISVHRLRRRFSAATGYGITAYVLAERTRLARDLLAAGATVAEAAAATGFKDPSYFARAFARRVGRPPSQIPHRGGGR